MKKNKVAKFIVIGAIVSGILAVAAYVIKRECDKELMDIDELMLDDLDGDDWDDDFFEDEDEE